MFCAQLVTGLPVAGSIADDDCQLDCPQGVFCVGRFAQSARVCAS